MLRYLEIREFALIDRLEMEFDAGLNLLTGETGSGKSIIVDALGLLLGAKAYTEMIRSGAEKSTVTGQFEIQNEQRLKSRFDAVGVNFSPEEIIIRRELSSNGKGKAFLNDQLVPTSFLREIAVFLVDIHGQNEQQSLLQAEAQLQFLDMFGGTSSLAGDVRSAFGVWQEGVRQIEAFRQNEQERLRSIDLYSFQLREIEAARLKATNEDEILTRERAVLSHSEKLSQLSEHAYGALYDDETSAGSLIKQAMRDLEEIQRIDSDWKAWQEPLQSARIEIEEVASLVRELASRIEFNPGRLEQVEQRVAELDRVKRKYGKTLNEVQAYFEKIKNELEQLKAADQNIEQLEDNVSKACGCYREQSAQLSTQRKKAARKLEKQVESELADLAMKECRFEVAFRKNGESPPPPAHRPGPDETATGVDTIEFQLSANPGEELKALSRIASGGEISRIMLALKSLQSVDHRSKTLVFDEVDAGIGGQTAHVLGQRLKRLSKQNQVMCVTHLPQIASFADQHFFVDKKTAEDRTVTRINRLGAKERVQEIARMISGDHRTESVLKHAAELIKKARNSG
ncbi:MAG: DNA repair protein RecN [Terriglobia bacterium]